VKGLKEARMNLKGEIIRLNLPGTGQWLVRVNNGLEIHFFGLRSEFETNKLLLPTEWEDYRVSLVYGGNPTAEPN